MALPALALAGGVVAVAAYLDAKHHIRHDVYNGVLSDPIAAAQKYTVERQGQGRMLVYHQLEDNVLSSRASNLFLEFEGRSWTYKQFYDDVQRIGNWLMNDLGVRQGEMVALNGPNSAEYLLLWFALEGIGACIAFSNCHLTGNPLVHSVKLAEARYMLAERGVEHLVEPCQDDLRAAGVETIYYDQAFLESKNDTTPLPTSRTSSILFTDLRGLIYTSGTTGLPKGVMSKKVPFRLKILLRLLTSPPIDRSNGWSMD
ncbi:hypothetical protein LTR17_020929 [Elasticomyces elasticus]|nr:hypothetical protein LTR17_020929 [Elasticomyces elasticus]